MEENLHNDSGKFINEAHDIGHLRFFEKTHLKISGKCRYGFGLIFSTGNNLYF